MSLRLDARGNSGSRVGTTEQPWCSRQSAGGSRRSCRRGWGRI